MKFELNGNVSVKAYRGCGEHPDPPDLQADLEHPEHQEHPVLLDNHPLHKLLQDPPAPPVHLDLLDAQVLQDQLVVLVLMVYQDQ